MKTEKESYQRLLKSKKNQKILDEYKSKIETMGRAKRSALAIFNILRNQPKTTIPDLVSLTKLSKQTVWSITKKLAAEGILYTMTDKKRYQTYCLSRIEGTAKELFACDIGLQNKAGVFLSFSNRTEAIAEADKPTKIKFHEDKRHNNKENNQHSKNSLYICDCIDGLKYLIKDKVKPYDLIFCDPPFNQVTARKTREYMDTFDQHSGYLQFMYPRLLLCKQLLAETGLMIIAIGETEYSHTRLICNEIFGEENFINSITVESGVVGGIYASHSKQMLPSVKQYQLLVFAKDHKKINFLNKLYDLVDNKKFAKEYNTIITPDLKHEHLIDYLKKEPWIVSEFEEHELNMTLNNIDKLMSVSQQFETYMYEKVVQLLYKATPPFRAQSEIAKIQPYNKVFLSEDNRLLLKQKSKPEAKIVEYKPFVNRVLDAGLGVQRGDLWKGFQRYKNSVQDRFGITFEGRKPIPLLQDLLVWINNKHARILDITAGSGSLGTATLAQNIKDSGQRCFCLMQLKEQTRNETNKKFKTVDKKTVFALDNSIKELGITEGYKIYRGNKN